MPTFVFQCKCGLQFEKSVRMSRRDKPVNCKCGEVAPRLMPEGVAGVFVQKAKGGPVPQNTGISSYDVHVDRVIGVSAEDGWGFQEKRDAVKREVLHQNPGAILRDLSHNTDGTWEVMPSKVKQRTYRGRLINEQAMESGQYTNHDREQ